MNDSKIPFALKDGKLVDINEVEKGLKSGCICPKCHLLVVARKGQKNIHHFAHYKRESCNGAAETALHLAAKEILIKSLKIKLPKLIFQEYYQLDKNYDGTIVKEECYVSIDSVIVEEKHNNFIPDVCLESQGQKLFIEIAVTHYIDSEKLQKIKNSKISCLEINLGFLYKSFVNGRETIDFNVLEELIINRTTGKKWIYNRKLESYKNQLEKFSKVYKYYKHRQAELYKLYSKELRVNFFETYDSYWNTVDCPLGKRFWKGGYKKGFPYADVDEDCKSCLYKVKRIYSEEEKLKAVRVFCVGHEKDIIDDINEGLYDEFIVGPKKRLKLD